MVRHWFMVEDCKKRSAQFESLLRAETADEAIKEAEGHYFKLTEHDKRERDEVYIIHAALDDGGCIDYETSDEYIPIKEDAKE